MLLVETCQLSGSCRGDSVTEWINYYCWRPYNAWLIGLGLVDRFYKDGIIIIYIG